MRIVKLMKKLMKTLVSFVMILAVVTIASTAFGVEAQTGKITGRNPFDDSCEP